MILEPKKILYPLLPHLFSMKWWDQMPQSKFSECWVVGVQPQWVQEYPSDEWHQWRRRQMHAEGCVEEVAFFSFLGYLSFYRMNVTSPLSHTYYIRYWFHAPVNIFLSHVFPRCIHLEHFQLQGFFLNVPYRVFFPQCPNIFILTTQCSTNLRYSVNSLDNKTIHGKGHSNMFDISENSTMWKPWYFSLPETTKSQFTMINC